jgi:hypothetical protein
MPGCYRVLTETTSVGILHRRGRWQRRVSLRYWRRPGGDQPDHSNRKTHNGNRAAYLSECSMAVLTATTKE